MSSIPLLLFAVVGGYWILVTAQKQEKPIGIIGKILGAIVVIVALSGLICKATTGLCHKGQCGTMGGMNSGCSSHAMPCPMKKDCPMGAMNAPAENHEQGETKGEK